MRETRRCQNGARRALLAVAGLLALVPLVAFSSAPRVPFTGQPPYLVQDTANGHNAEGEGSGVQMKMGTSRLTLVQRIDFYNDGGVGFYELEDTKSFLCIKEDPSKSYAVVELACASGHTSATAQEEEWTLSPPDLADSIQSLWEYNNYGGVMLDYNNQLWGDGDSSVNDGSCGLITPECDFNLIGTG